LLKKIPGINIDTNGTIKIGNQEVEKVMIDGDDMFEKEYKILTKNMPVNPIENVESLQNYSNNKHLKGIENSNKVALNLTLKEDYKRAWFGNTTLAFSFLSENRYDIKASLMNFGKKYKYYFLTNLNNVGYAATGDINHLIRPYRFDEPGRISDNQSVRTLLGLSFDTPNLKQRRVNLNNAEMLSLNSIFTPSDKIKFKTLGFLNTDEVDFFRKSLQSFSVGNTSFRNTEDFVGRKIQLTGFGKVDLNYDISKTKTFEYSGKFNKTNDKSRSNLSFNNDLLNERLNANNQLFDQKVVFTNRFENNKVFLISGRYINEKTPQSYLVNQFIFNELFIENANNTKQFSENSNIRFIVTNNLACAYLLLENKEKAIYYAELLIKNDQQTSRGTDIIDRVNKANFVTNTVRTHTNRFVELKKLGFQIQEYKEDARLAIFEKLERQVLD
jgi:hypothetical protein